MKTTPQRRAAAVTSYRSLPRSPNAPNVCQLGVFRVFVAVGASRYASCCENFAAHQSCARQTKLMLCAHNKSHYSSRLQNARLDASICYPIVQVGLCSSDIPMTVSMHRLYYLSARSSKCVILKNVCRQCNIQLPAARCTLHRARSMIAPLK